MFPGPLKILGAGPDWERGVLLAIPSKVVLEKHIAFSDMQKFTNEN
jgi:hypothetical protein